MAEPVARNPVPSLLRSLMSDHLDPGYAAAAESSSLGGRRGAVVLVLGTLILGCVFGVAFARADRSTDGRLRGEILAGVRDAEDRATALDSDRSSLLAEVSAARADALQDESGGTTVLADLDRLEVAAGASAVSGPGIVVTVSEPPAVADLSDVTHRTRGSSDAAVLDRDLQIVVNSLWVSGAEAVSVNDVRIGPGVTIRQAGGAMLVDNRPVFSPYRVSAIGPPNRLQAQFPVSDAYLRMTGLAQLYRIGFVVAVDDDIEMQPAAVRPSLVAIEAGPP